MAKREKILVVDDEQDLCEILRFNLKCEGFAVETAESAEQALKMLPDGYDLILLDVMMEGMSGFRMAEKVRKEQKLQVPIVFLTAKDTENDLLTGFSLGGDDYIPKPFSIKEVTARVKAVLKRSAAAPADTNRTIELGELTIDPETKSATLGNEHILVTKKEFEILMTLARTPNKVFSREDILERVWKKESYVLERTVDVHITRLRKKLGTFGERLTNRSGYGYCIEF